MHLIAIANQPGRRLARHMLWGLIGLALLAGVLTAPERSEAYPEPAIVSRAWAFDFEYRTPQLISIPTIEGQIRWFWYLTYKVTNNTDRERLFVPEITLATEMGDIVAAGRDVPAIVYDAIKERE